MSTQVRPALILSLFETVIVGANPGCLFDGSDATYVEAVSTAGFGSTVQVMLEPLTISGLSAFPLYVRAMYRVASGTPPSPLGMTINLSNSDTGEAYGFFTSNVSYGYLFAAPDTIYDITTWTWNEDHADATAHLLAALPTGFVQLSFDSRTHDNSDAGLRIIECYLLGDVNTLPPPLRRYPPVNNGGFGPTRHYPRAVNRRAGWSY